MDIAGNGVRQQASRRWTPEEDERLRENWEKMSAAELAELFGVDEPAVCGRIRALGLRRAGRPPLWTLEEDRAVRERFFSAGLSGLARELGRTETAVRIRAGRFGLTTRRRRLWSRDEVGRLCDLVRKGKTIAETARILGRPVASVQLKMRTLGLSSSRRAEAWTSDQMEILCASVSRGLPMGEISARLGRTQGACRQKAYRLGMLPRARRACMPAEDAQGGVQ